VTEYFFEEFHYLVLLKLSIGDTLSTLKKQTNNKNGFETDNTFLGRIRGI